jgi:mRNA-degrading endonuclease YafQ of YafQ-DinJ toxin-antitoxin module
MQKLKKIPTGRWNIKETEFIIRLLQNTTIPGTDVEQAHSILGKFKSLHDALLAHEIAG